MNPLNDENKQGYYMKGSKRWKKIFSHDSSGGLFADLKDAMNKNIRN